VSSTINLFGCTALAVVHTWAMAEFSSQCYDTLKHRVQQLKLEQQGLAEHRAKQKEVCCSWTA